MNRLESYRSPHRAPARVRPGVVTLLVLAPALLAGCSALTAIGDSVRTLVGTRVPFAQPPAEPALWPIRSVQISADARSGALADALRRRVDGTRIGGAPYYLGAAPPERTAVIALELADLRTQSETVREDRVKCPGKKVVNVCKGDEGYHYQVLCQLNSATASGSLLARTASGTMLASRSDRQQASSKLCQGDSGDLKSREALAAQVLETLTDGLSKGLLVEFEARPLDLFEDDPALPAHDAAFAAATAAAEQGQLGAARSTLEALEAGGTRSARLAFNLGYLHQALGDYARARSAYDQAATLPGAPTALIARYRAPVDTWVAQGLSALTDNPGPRLPASAAVPRPVTATTPAASGPAPGLTPGLAPGLAPARPPAAAVAGATALGLRPRPSRQSAVDTRVAASAGLRQTGQLTNAEGRWVFLQGPDGQGWALESEFQQAR